MKVNTSTLTGRALTWSVCKALGYVPARIDGGEHGPTHKPAPELEFSHSLILPGASRSVLFSTFDFETWVGAGPIIEQAGINVMLRYGSLPPNHVQDVWDALIKPEFYSTGRPGTGVKKEVMSSGPLPVTAAMRCFIASRLGDEVEIPEVLL